MPVITTWAGQCRLNLERKHFLFVYLLSQQNNLAVIVHCMHVHVHTFSAAGFGVCCRIRCVDHTQERLRHCGLTIKHQNFITSAFSPLIVLQTLPACAAAPWLVRVKAL